MNKSDDPSILNDLRERGYRLTPQRLAIMQILEEDGGHLSPVEIYERAITQIPGITEATVYRTLDFLARNGLVLVAHVGDGRLVYEVAGHNHHHLICHDCGTTVEIEHHLLEALYVQFDEQTGFTIDQRHATFFGLCPKCAKKGEL
jgi:Fur family ferric uptake transcriptional regulator